MHSGLWLLSLWKALLIEIDPSLPSRHWSMFRGAVTNFSLQLSLLGFLGTVMKWKKGMSSALLQIVSGELKLNYRLSYCIKLIPIFSQCAFDLFLILIFHQQGGFFCFQSAKWVFVWAITQNKPMCDWLLVIRWFQGGCFHPK